MQTYNEIVEDDLQQNPEFRRALLGEVLACMGSGDVETSKSVLHKYIEGTIGLDALARALHRPTTTLAQILGPAGSPTVQEFFEIVAYLQKIDSTVLTVQGLNALAA